LLEDLGFMVDFVVDYLAAHSKEQRVVRVQEIYGRSLELILECGHSRMQYSRVQGVPLMTDCVLCNYNAALRAHSVWSALR